MKFTERPVPKPYTLACFHYYTASGSMVGAVWQEEEGPWKAYCCVGAFGSLGDNYKDKDEAYAALERLALSLDART